MLIIEEQRLQHERKRSQANALYSSSGGQSSRGGSVPPGNYGEGHASGGTHGGPGGNVSFPFPAGGHDACGRSTSNHGGNGNGKQKRGPADRDLAPAHQAVFHPAPPGAPPGYLVWAGPSPPGPHAWRTQGRS